MTQDKHQQTDGSRIDTTTRRGALAALGGAGLLAALGGGAQANVGGGDDADELSHLLSRFYEGPEDELPEAGVEGRRFFVTDSGGQYKQWTLLRDQGDAWDPVDLTLGALGSDSLDTESLDNVADTIVSTTSELESAFNNLTAGKTVWIGQPDTPYRHSQWLDVDVSNVSIICQSAFAANGEALTKTADGANVGGIQVGRNAAVENVTIKGFGHDGNPTNQDSTVKRLHSIILDDVTNATVADCFVTRQHPYREHNSGGSGISVGVNATDVSIHGNLVDDQGDRGIECAGTNCRIYDNTTINGFDRGISLQHQGLDGGDWVNARDTAVYGNYVRDMSDGSGIKGRGLNDNVGTVEQSPRNIIIRKNVVEGQFRSGVAYEHLTPSADNIQIAGNTVRRTSADIYRPLVKLSAGGSVVKQLSLVGNNVKGDGTVDEVVGVRADYMRNGLIALNTVQNTQRGIQARNINGTIIALNSITDTADYGMYLEQGFNHNLVVSNSIQSYPTYGIYLGTNLDEANVQMNTCRQRSESADAGIRVESTDCLVTNNDLLNSGTTPLDDQGTGTVTTAGNRT